MNLLFANDRRGAYPPSWYAATADPLAPFRELRGETRADICVIGGGYTGLSAALCLAERGFDVVLAEAHRVGFGASGRNGGQVGSGQRLAQDTLERRHGADDARKLWQIAEDAKAEVARRIADHRISCGYRPGVAHVVRSARDVSRAHAYADRLARDYGYDRMDRLDGTGTRAMIGTEAFAGGVLDRGAGHLHPLRYALGLARAAAGIGVRIHEMSLVHGIEAGPRPVVKTDRGRVRADHVIVAANGYHGGLDDVLTSRVMPINNFIVATEPLGDAAAALLAEDIAVADDRFVVNYWRLSEDRRLLFGGGESYGYRFPRDIAALVRKPMLGIYPQLAEARIDYAWGGTLAITMSRMPHFARLGPAILSASGYSGHGVALATLAGRILAEAVSGQAERFDVMARVPAAAFPGGGALRTPLLALAMTWYALRDRLGL